MLKDTLSKFKNEKLAIFSDEIKEKLAREQKELIESHITDNAIKAGDVLPDFEVVDAHGNYYSKESFKNKKLVLNFFRGSWWPYCNMELGVLEEMQDEMEELGGKLISISPEVLDDSKKEDVKDAESLITSDIDNKFAKELGLVFKVRPEIVAQYLEWGIDLEKSQHNTNGELPMPATVITNENGVVVHVFVSTDYTERYEPEDILRVLAK